MASALETLSESPFIHHQLRSCTKSPKSGLEFLKAALNIDLEIICINNMVDPTTHVHGNVIDKKCKEYRAKYRALRNNPIQGKERGMRVYSRSYCLQTM